MKKMTTPLTSRKLLLLVFSFVIFACNKNDDNGTPPEDAPAPNIVELAESVAVLSDLVEALEVADAGLVEALSAAGANTVFAPTNDAFDTLFAELEGINSLSDIDEPAERALLAEILRYHVIGGTTAFSDNLSNGQVFETLQSEELTINVDGSIFIQDATDVDAEVVSSDNEASNGVVHIIDKILLPQAVLDLLNPLPSIVELVEETDDLSLFEEAIARAGLVDALNADGPFTVFAPSNAAIQELFDLLGDGFNSFEDFDNAIEIQLLNQILNFHVVEGNIASSDLTPGEVPTLLSGDSIEIIASGDTFVIGDASDEDANIVSADNGASNGIVHIIDKILIPTEIQALIGGSGSGDDPMGDGLFTIQELVEATEELSFLEEALRLTGLLETLGEDGPFTAFAPSNVALNGLFALLGAEYNSLDDFDTEYEIGLLRDVLLYHLLSGRLGSSDLTVGSLDTLSGDNTLEVVSSNGGFALRDATGFNANFLITDIPASNGVVHVVDRILVPISVIQDISREATDVLVDILESNPELDTAFRFFIRVNADLEALLNREFTFFFPTNQAFEELFASLDGYDSLEDFDTEEELRLLTRILAYHCVEDVRLTADQLVNDQLLNTLQGEQLQVRLQNGVFILDKTDIPAQVIEADRDVLRGVIHVVNKVLLPQEVLSAL